MSIASSPCIGVCTLDAPRALCLGCGRTLDEIAAWGGMSEPQRLAVMAELPGRLASAPMLDAAAADPELSPVREGQDRWTGAS